MPLTKDMVPTVIATGASARVDVTVAPKAKSGDQIVARNVHPAGHTRLPRYVRGKRGTIDRDHGVFVFPDTSAYGPGDTPQHLYSVWFSAQEVWGEGASKDDRVYLDLWDDYFDLA